MKRYVKVKLKGQVKPPADMVAAAKRTLGNRYEDFVREFPGEITAKKLCKYVETH